MKKIMTFIGVFIFSLSLVYAQAPDAPMSPAPTEISLIEILREGGVLMAPLIVLLFLAVTLIIYYFFTIRQNAVVSQNFMHSIDSLIKEKYYLGILTLCNRHDESIARIMYKTLDFATKNPEADFEQVSEVAAAEGSHQTNILNKHISYLADIGTIAPMVGLLGTVIGMIKSFKEISQGSFMGVRQMKLASGVYEALITTASGLIIGITALVFYAFFRGKVQKYVAELEMATTHILALLAVQYQKSVKGKPTKMPIELEPENVEPFLSDELTKRGKRDPKRI